MALLCISFFATEAVLLFGYFLYYFTEEMPHNEHGDIHSSSFLFVLDYLLVVSNCEKKTPGDQAMQ